MTGVLIACASKPKGGSLASLSKELDLPKTSLLRMLRTLEHGGFLTFQDGNYIPGPASFHLAQLLGKFQPKTEFPECARPMIDDLARETNESITLGILSNEKDSILYVAAIDSVEPLRYTIPVGSKRPIYCSASGKAVLAFLPREDQDRYIQSAQFEKITASTPDKEAFADILKQVRQTAVVYDRNVSFEGASAISSPIFDADGKSFAAVSLAGPTDRLDANLQSFQSLVRTMGERISRAVGYNGTYPAC